MISNYQTVVELAEQHMQELAREARMAALASRLERSSGRRFRPLFARMLRALAQRFDPTFTPVLRHSHIAVHP